MEIFRRIAWLRGRGEESVVANKRAKLRQLNANGEMGAGGGWVIRIQQSLKESSKFYRDKTIILLPPPSPGGE